MKANVSSRPSVHMSNGGMHHATAFAGLGDDCIAENSDGSSIVVPCDNSGGSGGTAGNSSSNNVSAAGMIASISSAFSNIFKTIQPIPAGCSQVTTTSGINSVQCLSTTQQQLGAGFNTSSLSSSLGISSSTLMLLAAGVVAIMLLKK